MEISILSIKEPELPLTEFFQRAKENLLEYCPVPPERVELTDKPSLYLEFRKIEDFEALYEKDFLIYTFLLDKIFTSSKFEAFLQKEREIITSNPGIENIPKDVEDNENFLVLRYRSNYLEPMRRNYNLVYRVNRLLGVQIMNEELHDGFIRFIKTKADFESMLVGNDEMEKWIQFFEVLQVDLTQPIIVEFLNIIKSYFE